MKLRSQFTTLLAAIALVVALGGIYQAIKLGTTEPERPPIYSHIESLVAFDYRDPGTPGEYILYSYMGDPMPDKLDPLEVKSMRNQSSYTVRLSTPEEEARTGKYRMEYRGLPQPTYYDYNGTWYYLNYATTSPAQFRDAQYSKPLAYLFGRVAYGAGLASGAGAIYNSGVSNMSSLESAASGSSALVGTFIAQKSCDATPAYEIFKLFLPFDTSSIPISADVSDSQLRYTTTQEEALDGGSPADGIREVALYQTSQTTHTTLSVADFDNLLIGGGEGGTRTFVNNSPGLHTHTLNATGETWIKKSGQASNCSATAGITCIGIYPRVTTGFTGANCTGGAQNNTKIEIGGSGSFTLYSPYLASFQPWKFWDY